MPSNHLILCLPLLLLPSIFPSLRAFSSELTLHIRWPKYWSFSFCINPSNEYSGLIFFRIDWFDLRAVQGTHKSLLQHYNLKASVLQHSAFFMAPLSMISQLVQLLSPVQLCDPMDCSTPGFPVHHQHLELAQTHVHRFSDAIQPSHPLLSPSPLSPLQSFPSSGSFPVSQFFTSGGQSIGVSASASVLSLNIQDWFPLGWTGLFSLQSKRFSRVFSNTTVQKHQFFSAQLSL